MYSPALLLCPTLAALACVRGRCILVCPLEAGAVTFRQDFAWCTGVSGDQGEGGGGFC